MRPVPLLLSAFALLPGLLTGADAYVLDPMTSSALFRIKHFNIAYFHGTFNAIEGKLQWDAANPTASSIEVSVQAASVDSRNEKRDAHLANADFFDAKQFPLLRFASSSFKALDANRYEVAGTFTMHGVSKPITITVTRTGEGKDPKGAHRIGFETVFTVKRSDYGMDKMLENIGDEVTVTFSTEGIRQ